MNKKSKSTLKKFENIMRVKNYSERTIDIYSHYLGIFLNDFDCDAYHISKTKAIEWMHNYKYSSVSQQNQIISSVKSFYKYIIKSDLKGIDVERPRKEKRLPVIIDSDFLLERISCIENLKHKAIITLAYSTGMRVSEVINLKIKDIDSNRMVIYIRQAKGRKDRVVGLTDKVLGLLRSYYKEYKPNEFMFNGQNSLKYSSSSCNNIVKKYIGKEYHFHLLRHSSLTAMIDGGTDLSIVQKVAGHQNPDTTTRYIHLSNHMLHQVAQPI